MSKIYVTGDTHGEIEMYRLWNTKLQTLTRDDYVIIAGDAGFIWRGFTGPDGGLHENDQRLINKLAELPFTILFIDGNHENHKALTQFPAMVWNGGKVHKISDNLYHLMRGQIFNIDGRTIFTFGGAESIDKEYRIIDKSWWKEEMPTEWEFALGLKKLEEVNFKVDYVITHTCRHFVIPNMINHWWNDINNPLEGYFTYLIKDCNLQFKRWYFGHWHYDDTTTLGGRAIYNDIENIDTGEIL